MKNDNTEWSRMEDTAGTMLWLLMLCGFFIAVVALIWQGIKWVAQTAEWSATTQSKWRWLMMAPIMAIFMPFWSVWQAVKWCGFQFFRLFLRTLIIIYHLFHQQK